MKSNRTVITTTVSALLCLLAAFKSSIIDLPSLGDLAVNTFNTSNWYEISLEQGESGILPSFPYNPPIYVLLIVSGALVKTVNQVGFETNSYWPLNLSVMIAYLSACFGLARLSNRSGRSRIATLSIILNPLGLYYCFFLGQLDILAVALLVWSMVLLTEQRTWLSAILASASIVAVKPQHALLGIALAAVYFALLKPNRRKWATSRWFVLIIILTVFTNVAYRLIPFYAESLAVNPQAQRLGWSSLFELFDGAYVVSRPLVFMFLALLAIFIVTSRFQPQMPEAILISAGALVAAFQASFGHTFGLTIFIFPLIVMALKSETRIETRLIIHTIGALCLVSWGTGLVGDVSEIFGLNFFANLAVQAPTVFAIEYSSLLISLEFICLVSCAIFGLALLAGWKIGGPGDEKADRFPSGFEVESK